jgi:hypothetical protein
MCYYADPRESRDLNQYNVLVPFTSRSGIYRRREILNTGKEKYEGLLKGSDPIIGNILSRVGGYT